MLLLKCPSQSKSTVLTDSDGAFSSLTAAAVTSSSLCSHWGLWSVLLRRATMVWFGSSDEQIRLFLSYILTFGVSAGIVLDRPASTDTALALNPRNTLLSFSLSSTVNRFLPQKQFQEECLCWCRRLLRVLSFFAELWAALSMSSETRTSDSSWRLSEGWGLPSGHQADRYFLLLLLRLRTVCPAVVFHVQIHKLVDSAAVFLLFPCPPAVSLV